MQAYQESKIYDDECYYMDIGITEQLKHVTKDVCIANETLCSLIQQGSDEAKIALCAKSIDRIEKNAKYFFEFSYNSLAMEDLIMAGIDGLLNAAYRFDINEGKSFAQYSFYYINHCIFTEIQENTYPIKVPMRHLSKISAIEKYFYIKNETDKNIALKLECSIEELQKYKRMLDCFFSYESIESLSEDAYEKFESEYLSTNPDDVFEIVAENNLRYDILPEILGTLTEREGMVINILWGLDIGEKRKKCVAQRVLRAKGMDITLNQISVLNERAIKKLQHPSRNYILQGFYNLTAQNIKKVKKKNKLSIFGLRLEIVGERLLYETYEIDRSSKNQLYDVMKHYISIYPIQINSAINVVKELFLEPDNIIDKIHGTLSVEEIEIWDKYVNERDLLKIIYDMEKSELLHTDIRAKLLNSNIYTVQTLENVKREHGLYYLVCIEYSKGEVEKLLEKVLNEIADSTQFQEYLSFVK